MPHGSRDRLRRRPLPRVPAPPARTSREEPPPELDAVKVPTLVVQGESDPFGTPPDSPNRTLARIPGTHSLKDESTVAAAVSEWLASLSSDFFE